jgi:hypothetical protein
VPASAPAGGLVGGSSSLGAAQGGTPAGLLAARGRFRDLRRDHQRPDRHSLHPGRDGPRDAAHHGSGWFTDRIDPRLLLLAYYSLRGVGLAVLPSLLSPHTTPGTWVFIIFYGLDWVATVPPTVMLCRDLFGAEVGPIVFGWVFASHQIGASIAALGAGVVRDRTGSYDLAFYAAAALCVIAAGLSMSIRREPPRRAGIGTRDDEAEFVPTT